jgi:hypothetical protein
MIAMLIITPRYSSLFLPDRQGLKKNSLTLFPFLFIIPMITSFYVLLSFSPAVSSSRKYVSKKVYVVGTGSHMKQAMLSLILPSFFVLAAVLNPLFHLNRITLPSISI